MRDIFHRIKQWLNFEKPICEHEWHPCVVHSLTYNEDKPAEICSLCKDWKPLTEAQFYSKFGESFYVASRRARHNES